MECSPGRKPWVSVLSYVSPKGATDWEIPMSEKPNAGDAEIIMRLYDLRRETEMRKARAWYAASFWPTSADDVIQVINVANPQENAWFRQVSGYWEMAASF